MAPNSPFSTLVTPTGVCARGLARAWPRSGIPRALHDYDDFRALARLLTAAADVPDYTWFWWKLRPQPRLGTVEVRA
jgi:carboxylate-amine ligase